MRLGLIVGAIVLAVTTAACGGGGVPQAEYDLKVAELALAQRDLVDARDRVDQLEAAAAGTDAVLSEVEAAVLAALGLEGITADPGRDRIDLLAEAVAATAEERDMLLSAVEEGGGEFGPGFDVVRVEGLLQIALAMQDWARPTNLPDDATAFDAIAETVDQVGDEMVGLAYGQLLQSYADAEPDDRIALLLDVAFWAVDIARSSLPS